MYIHIIIYIYITSSIGCIIVSSEKEALTSTHREIVAGSYDVIFKREMTYCGQLFYNYSQTRWYNRLDLPFQNHQQGYV